MEATIGEIRMFAGNFPPSGWFFCDGSELSVDTYPGAFKVIGNIYGGDGINTFGIPNLNGRIAIGVSDQVSLGQKLGAESIILDDELMAAHTHQYLASSSAQSADQPAGHVLATNSRSINPPMPNIYTAAENLVAMGTGIAQTGSSAPLYITQPISVIHYMIFIQHINTEN